VAEGGDVNRRGHFSRLDDPSFRYLPLYILLTLVIIPCILRDARRDLFAFAYRLLGVWVPIVCYQ
jgi:hypothetical protein